MKLKRTIQQIGIMNTKDILYYVENQFKQDLSDCYGNSKVK